VEIGRQAGQKPADLCLAHLSRMSLAVEEDEPFDPTSIGLLGVVTEVS
jgi:hypothetical protein